MIRYIELYYYIYTFLPDEEGDFCFMGEALIIRSGGGMINGGYIPKTEIITVNQNFIVPEAKGQQFAVRIFGAGGDYYSRAGGGGGNMNNAVLILNEGDSIPITIGEVVKDNNGGSTLFGTYLSATGGERGLKNNGGNGGTGGGGLKRGGHGTYGGGGGASDSYNSKNDSQTSYGGNGGIYGGGGGGYFPGISTGGWGNGGNDTIEAENGLNTIGLGLEFESDGTCGNYVIISNWNHETDKYDKQILNIARYAGGGGYGGRGGNGYKELYYGGGGGGGYGGRGGDGGVQAGGGGGGYGNNGGSSGEVPSLWRYGSGGYGGGYGPDGYGHGGGYNATASSRVIDPMPGICIISYMQPIQS